MVNKSTNINKTSIIISHLKQLNIKNTTTYDVGNLVSGLEEAQTWSGGKQVNGITTVYAINFSTHWLGDTCVY
jgi:hypothetical protein